MTLMDIEQPSENAFVGLLNIFGNFTLCVNQYMDATNFIHFSNKISMVYIKYVCFIGVRLCQRLLFIYNVRGLCFSAVFSTLPLFRWRSNFTGKKLFANGLDGNSFSIIHWNIHFTRVGMRTLHVLSTDSEDERMAFKSYFKGLTQSGQES